jgi:serine/threonine-protein kinase
LIGAVLNEKYKVVLLIKKTNREINTYLVIHLKLNKMFYMTSYNKKDPIYNDIIRSDIKHTVDATKGLHHPAICHVIDFFEDQTRYYVVQEYATGDTLARLLEQQGRQPVEKVAAWGKQLCDVLSYLHGQEPPRIYRNLRPESIGLTSDGDIKLLDFSIMVCGNQPQSEGFGCTTGCAGYAPPEQYDGRLAATARTDVYGLGATMYRLLTGVVPDQSPECVDFSKSPFDSAEFQQMQEIIIKCMRAKPDDRYHSCDELKAALEQVYR